MKEINLESITLEDCVFLNDCRGIEAVINDGQIVAFTNFFDCNPNGYTE